MNDLVMEATGLDVMGGFAASGDLAAGAYTRPLFSST